MPAATSTTKRATTSGKAATTVPTSPPTNAAQGAHLNTNGSGQSPANGFATQGAQETGNAVNGLASVAIPTGVWGATAGLSPAASSGGGTTGAAVVGLASAVGSTSTVASTSKKFPIIPVAAGAGGGLLVLIGAIVGIVCCVKRRRRSQRDSFRQRTATLRNSYISAPVYEKAPSYNNAMRMNDYGAAGQTIDNYYYEPTYDSQGYDAQPGGGYAQSEYYSEKPSRFAHSAQDRGYGMR